MDKKRFLGNPYVHLLLIAVASLICYSNTFHVPFHFDDSTLIVKNPFIKDFSYFITPSKIDSLDINRDVNLYFKTRYVGFLSLWANYKVGGLDVKGYHILNLAIHILNAVLVYLIVTLTFKAPVLGDFRFEERSGTIAFFSSLLFAVHPVQTEAVTYILSRFVLLTAMFYLLSIAAYIGSRLSKGRASKYSLYVVALASAILAMKTKEPAFTLPVAIALYELMFLRADTRKRFLLLTPLFLTMLIIPLEYIDMSMNTETGFGATIEGATKYPGAPSRPDYLYTQFRVVVSYIGILLFPTNQTVDHYHPVYHTFFEPPVFLSFIILLGFFTFGVYCLSRSRITLSSSEFGVRSSGINSLHVAHCPSRIIAFGIFWFFLALSVESSLLPITEIMVEYRIYLPSVGFLTAAVVLIFILSSRLQLWGKYPQARRALVPILVLIMAVLGTTTHLRNNVWATEISLWEDVVRKSPQKMRGYYNLGNLYRTERQYDKAISHYKEALKLSPDIPRAHNNLGLAYKSKGQYDMALPHLLEALRLSPNIRAIHINLGVVYRSLGTFDKSIAHFKKALESEPNNAMIHLNLSESYRAMGIDEKAAYHFRIATGGSGS
jgi:Tfp pilus assembly protein PilF